MNEEKTLLDKIKILYAELQLSVSSTEKDLEENLYKNNKSAGGRARKTLRDIKRKAAELSRALLDLNKGRK